MLLRQLIFVSLILFSKLVYADVVSVAVASNALDAIKLIGDDFHRQYGHTLRISSGSTGKLYAQIYNGAPFDIFLAANAREPERLEKQGMIVKGSRFTYALGQLSLCHQDGIQPADIKKILQHPKLKRLAMANPRTAPYGVAARQVLESLGLWRAMQGSLIRGENIGQAYQYYVSGNAQAAFLASAQVMSKKPQGKCLAVDRRLYQPIRQQAVVLKRAKDNIAVKLFEDFLKGHYVKTLLSTKFGYGVN